jgi:predicted rRNA methylase
VAKPTVKKDKNSKEKGGLFLIEGKSVLLEYVNHAPHLIKAICCKDKKDEAQFSKFEAKIIKFDLWDKTYKDTYRKPTSPVFAIVEVPQFDSVDLLHHLKANNNRLIVMLDHIQDPRNLGAIARSLAFFGVSVLIIPNARQTPVTEFSLMTSQGAFAHINVYVVSNLSRVCSEIKELGYWILGADMTGESISELSGFYEKTCLLLGNEEKGLSRLIRENCDRMISIQRSEGKLESLNVSVAAGILIAGLTSK